MKPTKIYVKNVLPALRTNLVKGFAHITGGGLIENIPRILPKNFSVTLDATKWNVLPIFGWLAAVGDYYFKQISFRSLEFTYFRV